MYVSVSYSVPLPITIHSWSARAECGIKAMMTLTYAADAVLFKSNQICTARLRLCGLLKHLAEYRSSLFSADECNPAEWQSFGTTSHQDMATFNNTTCSALDATRFVQDLAFTSSNSSTTINITIQATTARRSDTATPWARVNQTSAAAVFGNVLKASDKGLVAIQAHSDHTADSLRSAIRSARLRRSTDQLEHSRRRRSSSEEESVDCRRHEFTVHRNLLNFAVGIIQQPEYIRLGYCFGSCKNNITDLESAASPYHQTLYQLAQNDADFVPDCTPLSTEPIRLLVSDYQGRAESWATVHYHWDVGSCGCA